MEILSFNLGGNSKGNGTPDLGTNKQAFVQLAQEQSPALMLLQEMRHETLEKEMLKYAAVYTGGCGQRKSISDKPDTGVYYNQEIFEAIRPDGVHSGIDLEEDSSSAQRPHTRSFNAPVPLFIGRYTAMRLRLKTIQSLNCGHMEILVVSYHGATKSLEGYTRRDTAMTFLELVRKYANKNNIPAIVGGDFQVDKMGLQKGGIFSQDSSLVTADKDPYRTPIDHFYVYNPPSSPFKLYCEFLEGLASKMDETFDHQPIVASLHFVRR